MQIQCRSENQRTSLLLKGNHTSETSLMQLQEFSDVNASLHPTMEEILPGTRIQTVKEEKISGMVAK